MSGMGYLQDDFQELPGDILTKIKYTAVFSFESVSKFNEEACGDRLRATPIT